MAVYHCNRAACKVAMEDWSGAEEDARKSLDFNPNHIKAHYRLCQSLLQMGKYEDAADAAKCGLELDGTNKDLSRLAQVAAARAREKLEKTLKKKNSAKSFHPTLGSLYEEKGGASSSSKAHAAKKASVDPGSNAAVLSQIKETMRAGGHTLQGEFAELLIPEKFQKRVFPGLSPAQCAEVPSTLQQLMDDERYRVALEACIPRALKKAESVIESVKAKGAKRGDVMVPDIERTLRPQALVEAFARELPGAVRSMHAAARLDAAGDDSLLADPNAEEAQWELLDDNIISDLSDDSIAFAVQEEFMPDEWMKVIYRDLENFARSEKLRSIEGAGHSVGELAWLDKKDLEGTFPALHEVVTYLQVLPHELNLHVPRLKLKRALPHSTMVHRISKGAAVPERLDSDVDGTLTGFKVTAVYMAGLERDTNITDSCRGGELRLVHSQTGEEHLIQHEPNKLVLFRSDIVRNERRAAPEGLAIWSLIHWMHGA
jgi:hypothetical protein